MSGKRALGDLRGAGRLSEIEGVRSPSLQGVFDIKQARLSGYPYAMYIKDMAGSISHVHLSDVDGNGKMCLPGKGRTDFFEVFSRLKDAGFDGAAIVEAYTGDYGEYAELKESCDYLDEVIDHIDTEKVQEISPQ